MAKEVAPEHLALLEVPVPPCVKFEATVKVLCMDAWAGVWDTGKVVCSLESLVLVKA